MLGLSSLLWSAMTGLCGTATGFWSLLVARLGVGEAGGGPATHSLIARRVDPRWRGTAFGIIGLAEAGGAAAAIYNLGMNLVGPGLGPALVGWLSDLLTPAYGAESLRYALVIVKCSFLPGVIAFALAIRTARQDIGAAG